MKLTNVIAGALTTAALLVSSAALADSYNFTLFNEGTRVDQRGQVMRTSDNKSNSGGFALRVNKGQTFALKVGSTCYEVTPTNLPVASAQYFFPTNDGELTQSLSARNSSGQQIFSQQACGFQYSAWSTPLPLACPSNINCDTTVSVSSERTCVQSIGEVVDCSLCGADACTATRTCSGGACPNGGDGGGDDCFAADTHVTMADGSVKAISEVVEGDEVVAFDRSAPEGVLTTAKVTEVVYTNSQDVYSINNGWIEANANHPILMKDGSWKSVSYLVLGDEIRMEDGSLTTVTELGFTGRNELTYNLQLEGGKGYIAEGARVLGVSAKTADLASAE